MLLTNTFSPDIPLLIGFLDMETVNKEGTLYMGREKARHPAPRHGCLGPQPDLPGLVFMGPGKWLRVWKAGKLPSSSLCSRPFQPFRLSPATVVPASCHCLCWSIHQRPLLGQLTATCQGRWGHIKSHRATCEAPWSSCVQQEPDRCSEVLYVCFQLCSRESSWHMSKPVHAVCGCLGATTDSGFKAL